MNERTPPLARDLSGIGAGYTWKYGEAGAGTSSSRESDEPAEVGTDELERLRAEVKHLALALEDVVALALSGADYKERAIMMHRRAVAALSARGVRSPAPAPRPPKSEDKR